MGVQTSPSQLRAQGMEALKERRHAAAAGLLMRYLDSVPNDREAELALAVARSGQGKHAAAMVIFDRLLETDPRSPALHFNRAMTLERMGRKASAFEGYELVLRLQPDHAKARQRVTALRGQSQPAVDEIPVVTAVDEDETGESGPARRQKGGKQRWIHPAWLISLCVYVATMVAFPFLAMPTTEMAVGYAGGAVLSALLFLAGLQTVHRARRGLTRIPAAIGHVLVIVGALGLVNDCAMNVYYLAAGPAPARIVSGPRQPAAGNVQSNQGRRTDRPERAEPDGNPKARVDFGKNPGLIETAIQAIRGGNEREIGAACLALRDNYRGARKGGSRPVAGGATRPC